MASRQWCQDANVHFHGYPIWSAKNQINAVGSWSSVLRIHPSSPALRSATHGSPCRGMKTQLTAVAGPIFRRPSCRTSYKRTQITTRKVIAACPPRAETETGTICGNIGSSGGRARRILGLEFPVQMTWTGLNGRDLQIAVWASFRVDHSLPSSAEEAISRRSCYNCA